MEKYRPPVLTPKSLRQGFRSMQGHTLFVPPQLVAKAKKLLYYSENVTKNKNMWATFSRAFRNGEDDMGRAKWEFEVECRFLIPHVERRVSEIKKENVLLKKEEGKLKKELLKKGAAQKDLQDFDGYDEDNLTSICRVRASKLKAVTNKIELNEKRRKEFDAYLKALNLDHDKKLMLDIDDFNYFEV